MKKFAFSFQYLLDAHSAKEQAAEHALQLANKQKIDAEKTLQSLEETRQWQVAAMAQMSGVVKRSDYAAYMRSLDGIDRVIVDAIDTIHSYSRLVNDRRLALKKEMTARKVLENLCEREREEWIDNLQREEQKQMDELAVGRWNRLEKRI